MVYSLRLQKYLKMPHIINKPIVIFGVRFLKNKPIDKIQERFVV